MITVHFLFVSTGTEGNKSINIVGVDYLHPTWASCLSATFLSMQCVNAASLPELTSLCKCYPSSHCLPGTLFIFSHSFPDVGKTWQNITDTYHFLCGSLTQSFKTMKWNTGCLWMWRGRFWRICGTHTFQFWESEEKNETISRLPKGPASQQPLSGGIRMSGMFKEWASHMTANIIKLTI